MAALLVLATICRRPVTLTFDLLTLKLVWESHVTWGIPVQSFVFLGLLVFKLEPMYATSDRRTDRQTDRRTTDADDRLMPPPPLRGRGHNNWCWCVLSMRRGKCSATVTFCQRHRSIGKSLESSNKFSTTIEEIPLSCQTEEDRRRFSERQKA